MELKDLVIIKQIAQEDITNEYFSEKQYKIILKMCIVEAKQLYEDICADRNICPICGKEINRNGKMTVGDSGFQNPQVHVITLPVCPDQNCEYNKQLLRTIQKEFEDYVNGSRKTRFSGIDFYNK